MTEVNENLFEIAFEKYKNGAPIEELISDFMHIVELTPSHFAGWTCLSWLQLLIDDNSNALVSARNAVRLNNKDPQARVNLSLALLATKSKGVRDQVEFVQKCLFMVPEIKDELRDSINDGLLRKPSWAELIKVKNWLDL